MLDWWRRRKAIREAAKRDEYVAKLRNSANSLCGVTHFGDPPFLGIDDVQRLIRKELDQQAGGDRLEQEVERLRTQLDRAIVQQGGQRVPEGWKLVPVEPTPRMVEAFYRAYERPLSPVRWESPFSNAWEALLAAAPQPDHGESDE